MLFAVWLLCHMEDHHATLLHTLTFTWRDLEMIHIYMYMHGYPEVPGKYIRNYPALNAILLMNPQEYRSPLLLVLKADAL